MSVMEDPLAAAKKANKKKGKKANKAAGNDKKAKAEKRKSKEPVEDEEEAMEVDQVENEAPAPPKKAKKAAEGAPKAKKAGEKIKKANSKKGSNDDEEPKEKKPKTEEEKKAERKKQKSLKAERQTKAKGESVYTLGQQAKQVWEKVRREDCPDDEREKLLDELHAAVKGNVKKLIFAHDTVRVVECLVAKGGDRIKEELFQEMKEEIVTMAKSQYAYFFVVKLIKYGSKTQRKIIYEAFKGKVAELMKHKVANNAVDMYYNEVT